VWAPIFETEIYFMILYYYIYLAYLGSWYCPKGFLLWPLVATEKVGMRSADLSGYSVGSHLFIFVLILLQDAVLWPLVGIVYVPIWFWFVNSQIVISFWRYGNWRHTYPLAFIFVRWITRFSRPEYVPMHTHSPRTLSSREPELSVYAVLVPHKYKVLSS
jgi:hypothetical protein